jgi:hypothetical protein
MPSTRKVQVAIARQSWSLFQALIANPATAPFLLKALRAIERDPDSGSLFRAGVAGSSMRKDVVALTGDKQLWLFWNPAMDPIEVALTVR